MPAAHARLPPQIGVPTLATRWRLRRPPDERGPCLPRLRGVASCFTPPAAPPLPMLWSMVTGKPGPSVANASAAGCVGSIIRPPAALLAPQAISSELDLLEARAQFDATERSVHVRIAEQARQVYLDLADDHWRAVEIGPDGWRVNRCPPVRFRRRAGMLPLPMPEKGGSIEALLPFLNLSTRNDFVLVVSWLLATLRAFGPYPLLAVSGEQGSAKTVLSKMLKALVDPNTAPVRALPRDERELMIAANNGYLLAFDNLSWLPPRLSDALCRLASGGSFAVRQLYTDDDEVLFQAAPRPCS